MDKRISKPTEVTHICFYPKLLKYLYKKSFSISLAFPTWFECIL